MTFLKKLGTVMLRVGQLVIGIGPVLSQVAGTVQVVSRDLSAIVRIIIQVEAMGAALGLDGPSKLKAATVLVEQVILDLEIMSGKTFANPELLHKACEGFAQAGCDLLNAIDQSHVETISKLRA